MSDPAAPKPHPGPVHHARGWRVPALWLVSVLVRAWSRTLRFEIDAAAFAAARARATPLTIMLWHNRLFVVPRLVREAWTGRRLHALISASRDGADLSRFFGYFGVRVVRGSSSRFGREALQELISVQRAGGDIAITPDGPRGPVYQLKAGAVLAARRTRSPIMLVGVRYGSAWRVRSWDRFCIPRPFSRVTFCIEIVDADALPPDEAGVAWLQGRLLALSGEDAGDAKSGS